MRKNYLLRPAVWMVVCGWSSLQLGCVTHYPATNELEEHEAMSAHQASGASQSAVAPEELASAAPVEDGLSPAVVATLVTKLSQIEGQLSEDDYQALRRLPADTSRGSLEEAAKVLGSIHLAIQGQATPDSSFGNLSSPGATAVLPTPSEDTKSSEEGQQGEDPTQGGSLEEWANHLQVRLPVALAYNQYLKAYGVQVLVLRALKKGGKQSDEFVAELTAAVRQNVKLWSELQQQLVQEEQSLTGEAADTLAGESAGQTASVPSGEAGLQGVAPALPFGGAEFSNDEDLLRQGQSLIDDGKYQEAIKILKGLSETNLFHAAAQEKIKDASNLAVQDLRRKAAKAFQSAIPVADRRARAAYLEDARRYLQAAIELYPDAEQIPTVQQNLHVINKNLEVLSASPAQAQ